MFGSYEPFLEISLQRNFQGLLSIVQLSRFLSFSQKRQLGYSIKHHLLCQELFYFSVSLLRFPFSPLQATACIGYHIRKALSTVFSVFFSTLPVPFLPLSCPRLFRLRVSGWHDLMRLFKALSSATGAILSLGSRVVNVFCAFYLFQTIHAILLIL